MTLIIMNRTLYKRYLQLKDTTENNDIEKIRQQGSTNTDDYILQRTSVMDTQKVADSD